MDLLDVPNEIILTICELLEDRDKLCLTSTCKRLLSFKGLLHYDTEITFTKIKNLSYKYNFTKIIARSNSDLNELINFKQFFSSLRHLRFDMHFNKSLKNCLPESITHLRFGYLFNEDLEYHHL